MVVNGSELSRGMSPVPSISVQFISNAVVSDFWVLHRADSLCSPIIGACRDWAVEFLSKGSYWGRSPGSSPEGEGRQEISVCSYSVSVARCGRTAACCGCTTACCRSSGARRPSGSAVPPSVTPRGIPSTGLDLISSTPEG